MTELQKRAITEAKEIIYQFNIYILSRKIDDKLKSMDISPELRNTFKGVFENEMKITQENIGKASNWLSAVLTEK